MTERLTITASEAAWGLHEENLRLRAELDETRAELRKATSRIDSLERSGEKLRSRLYVARLSRTKVAA